MTDTRLIALSRHIGRVGLASLFLLGGINKLSSFAATAERMESVGLVPVIVLMPATIALELIGGAMLALKAQFAWIAALLLAVFTLATNLYFHAFWTLEGELRALELSLFFKNVAIAGALVFAASVLFPSDQKAA
ncbi:MAG: DoxX family protein [Pseudomonadota bacterium]